MRLLFLIILTIISCSSFAYDSNDELRIAVASNFSPVLKRIVDKFQEDISQEILVSSASSGKLYAQIVNGANFHIFFSADILRAKLLDQAGLIVSGSRKTYAIGKLVLWGKSQEVIQTHYRGIDLHQLRFLAIANPKLAPYGLAARKYLRQQGLWEKIQSKLVRGENVAQAFQFVMSGNAEVGLVAFSQVKNLQHGKFMELKKTILIEQQLVLLRKSTLAEKFLQFLQLEKVKKLIVQQGYSLPNA